MSKHILLMLLFLHNISLTAQVFQLTVPVKSYLAGLCFGSSKAALTEGNLFLLKQGNQIVGMTAAHVVAAHIAEQSIKVNNSFDLKWKEKIADSFNDIAIFPPDSIAKYFKSHLSTALTPDFDFAHLTKGQTVVIQSQMGNKMGKIVSIGKGMGDKLFNQNIITCNFDYPVTEGYSGSPLMANAKVVGMIIAAEGNTAYAIGGDFLAKSLQDLLNYQHISRPYLGVCLGENQGTNYIKGLMSLSPARSAGTREGDIILAINKKAVKSLANVLTELDKYKFQDIIELQIQRETQNFTIKIPAGDLRDKDETKNKEYANFPQYFFNEFTPKDGKSIWVPDFKATNISFRYYDPNNPDAHTGAISGGTDCDNKLNFILSNRTWDDLGEVLRICNIEGGKFTILLAKNERIVYEVGKILFY